LYGNVDFDSFDGLASSRQDLVKKVQERTKELEQEIEERKQVENRLRHLASELSLAEERERRRIATNLHDRIGQTLSICKLKLESLQEAKPLNRHSELIDEVRELVDQTIKNTRLLTFELSPPALYMLGLEAALEGLANQIQDQHGILCDFEDYGESAHLDDDVRAVLFQAVRELLFNVVKHAQADSVKVSAWKCDGEVRINVEDDGIGFDTSQLTPQTYKTDGFGLFIISERLDYIGGYLEISSEPGRGTLVALTAPLRRGTESITV